jgi:AraC family transcriptional regulator
LLEQQRSVTETAMALGFGTPQSYARAFRRKTGTSPTEHQNAHGQLPAESYRMPEVTLEQRGDQLVVALRREGKPYTDLNATFAVVWDWAAACGVLEELTGIYGIPWDDPGAVATDQLRYDACLSFSVVTNPPAQFRSLVLPGGHYARLRHQGSYDALEDLDQYLVGEWLPDSGEEAADFPVFHRFLNDPDQTPVEELQTDVLLRLK